MLRLMGFLALLGCATDETVTAYADGQTEFVLRTLNGTPFAATATINIAEPGRVSGTAPCNTYSASQSAPYPWFEIGPIAVTRRACPDLAAETAFLGALAAMTLAEVTGNTLILSNTEQGEMVFQASP